MDRWKKLMVLFAALGLLGLGCAESTCEKICDSCKVRDGAEEDCRADCKEAYGEGGSECKSAMRDLADCVDDKGCGSLACVDEFADVYDECDIDFTF